MKKSLLLLVFLLAFLFVFNSISMAEGEREGTIIAKVGVQIPTNDEFDTLSGSSWTVEGEYIVYSTEYFDISAIGGYYRGNLPNALFQNKAAHIDTFYYMGGIKYYPIKEDFYFGCFIGGATNWVSPDEGLADSTNTAFAMKGVVGYEYEQFIVEVSYMGQFNEDLTNAINWNPNRTVLNPYQPIFQSHTGIQIMGGYKF